MRKIIDTIIQQAIDIPLNIAQIVLTALLKLLIDELVAGRKYRVAVQHKYSGKYRDKRKDNPSSDGLYHLYPLSESQILYVSLSLNPETMCGPHTVKMCKFF